MATVAVTADVSRIAVATIASDSGTWGNDGGGGAVTDESDIVYQTTTAQSRKIGTAVIGRNYNHGSGTDMDGTPASTAHYIAKIQVTNPNVLLTRTSPALHMKIGSSSTEYDTYYLYGSDNYPARGGWQIVPIAPSVSGYRDATTGTPPTRSAILYWSILGDFSTTSKAENVVIDAIDVGLGLGLVGGDGASTDGVFNDFVAFDEGTSTNRHGFCFKEGNIVFFCGEIRIGQTGSTQTSTLTVFQDAGVTCEWINGLVTTGFHRLLIDLATSGTDVDFVNCNLQSQGKANNDADRGYTTSEDSRPVLEVTGTSGTFGVTGGVINNFSTITLTSACTFTNVVLTDCNLLTQASATLTGCAISGATNGDGAAFIVSDDLALISGCEFTFSDGHAIEITATGTYTFTDNVFTGYGSTGTNDAAIYNNSGGLVTINVGGSGSTPTYRNGSGASTVVNNNKTITFSGLIAGSEVRVYLTGTSTEVDGIENSGTSFNFSIGSGVAVDYVILGPLVDPRIPIRQENISWTADTTIVVTQLINRNFLNPV